MSSQPVEYEYPAKRGSGTFVEIPYNGFDHRYEMNPVAQQQIDSGIVQEQPPSRHDFRPDQPKVSAAVPGICQSQRNEYGVGGQWCVMYTPGIEKQHEEQKQQDEPNASDVKSRDIDLKQWDKDESEATDASTEDLRYTEDWHQERRMSDGSKWKGPFWQQKHGNPVKPRKDEISSVIFSPDAPRRVFKLPTNKPEQEEETEDERKRREVELGEYYSPINKLPPVRNTQRNSIKGFAPPLSPVQDEEEMRKKHIHDVGDYYSPFGPLPPLRKKEQNPTNGIVPPPPLAM